MESRRPRVGIAGLAAVAALLAAILRRRREPAGWRGDPGPPPAGVREPRRPLQPAGSGAAAVDPPASPEG